jgi:hypothetical protein
VDQSLAPLVPYTWSALISATEMTRAQEATNIAFSWSILRPATPGPTALPICLATPLLTPSGASSSTLADSLGDFAVTLIGASLPAPPVDSFGHMASTSAPPLHIGSLRMGPWSATGTQPWKWPEHSSQKPAFPGATGSG